jgi:DNA-binding response OmpR family regulator
MPDVTERPILLVDDQPEIIDLMRRCLRLGGFENVADAHTGSAARELLKLGEGVPRAQEPPFDLVLLDVVLPDTSGFELCEALKLAYPDVYVILVSGYSIESIQAQLIECGADDFLAKPFNHQELLARVRIHLHKVLRERRQRPQKPRTDTETLPQVADTQMTVRPMDDFGDYEIIRSVVRTGATIIYLARHKTSGELRVIKMLQRHLLDYADVIARFKQEVKIIRGLDNPYIVRWYDDGTWDGCPYLVEEYVEGADLEHFINAGTQFEHEKMLQIAKQAAMGLQAVHDGGIIHRDVKPKNILLRESDGVVKLFDFGISFKMGEARVTQAEYTVGTPLYMAPEMFQSGKVSLQADVYSYGITLYHLAAGRLPFVSDNVAELVRAHQARQPEPLTELRPDLPAAWQELIVDKCMAKDEADRPQSMNAVLDELAKF